MLMLIHYRECCLDVGDKRGGHDEEYAIHE